MLIALIAIAIFGLAGMAIFSASSLTPALTTTTATGTGIVGAFVGYLSGGYANLMDVITLGLSMQYIGATLLTLGLVAFVCVLVWNITITGGRTAVR